jgi:hypothetical protein
MFSYKIHPSISHFNEDQVNELIRRYYNNEPISELINYFDIQTDESELSSIFPD